MTRWLLILLLGAGPAWAQEGATAFPPDASGGGATYDGGSVTNPFLAPDGCSLPGYSFTNDTDTGVCRDPNILFAGDDTLYFATGGNLAAQFKANQSYYRFFGFYTDDSNFEYLELEAIPGQGYYRIHPWSLGTGNDTIALMLEGLHPLGLQDARVLINSRLFTAFDIQSSGDVATLGEFYAGNGGTGAPAYSFTSATTDGMRWIPGGFGGLTIESAGPIMELRTVVGSAIGGMNFWPANSGNGNYIYHTTGTGSTAFVQIRVAETEIGHSVSGVGNNEVAADVNGIRFTTNAQAAQPTCDATRWRHFWYIEGGVGVQDDLQLCMKNASDTYNWVSIAVGGP
jgi:hypothetical protein